MRKKDSVFFRALHSRNLPVSFSSIEGTVGFTMTYRDQFDRKTEDTKKLVIYYL